MKDEVFIGMGSKERTMRKVSLAAVFFVLSLAVVGIAVGGVIAVDNTADSTQSTVHHQENTTNYLSPAPGETETTEYHRVSIDVSSVIDSSAREIHAEHERYAFEVALSTADEAETRALVAEQKLDEIDRRYQRLDQHQEDVFSEYERGTIESAAVVRELTALKSVIELQSDLRQRAEQETDPDSSLLSKLHSQEHALLVEQPVSDQLEQSLHGTTDPTTVYLQSGDSGLVLATIDDSTFKREATIRSERNLDGQDQFVETGEDEFQWGMGNAFPRSNELYPWAFDRDNLIQHDIGRADSSIHSQVYKITAHHLHGELSVYLDGGTTNVFHEAQTKPLSLLPVTETVSNSTDEYTLELELTDRAGPMLAAVVDDDGTPITDASVTVDGQHVGTTDESGQLWIVRPHGPFEVSVSPDGERSVHVSSS